MWKLIELNRYRYSLLKALFDNVRKKAQPFSSIQNGESTSLIIVKEMEHSYLVAFSPDYFDALQSVRHEIASYEPVLSEQPKDIGTEGGYKFLFGDRSLFKKLSLQYVSDN